jgi:hypothetical protein
LQFVTPEGKSLPGYVFTDSKQDEPLVALLSWLSTSLPRVSLPHPPILSYLVQDVATLKGQHDEAKP